MLQKVHRGNIAVQRETHRRRHQRLLLNFVSRALAFDERVVFISVLGIHMLGHVGAVQIKSSDLGVLLILYKNSFVGFPE